MFQSLKDKLAPKNKIVEHYQRGLLSESEFQREMSKLNLSEKRANELFGGIEDNWAELHGASQDENGDWSV